MGHRTQSEVSVDPQNIGRYRLTRKKSAFQGCTQVNQIFLKANGKISCSCMRYYHILADARDTDVGAWFDGQMMQYIRESYKEGFDPFSFCQNCLSRHATMDVEKASQELGLHIEPSSQCNLWCSECLCTEERRFDNPPPRVNLDFAVYEKILRDLARAGKTPGSVAFVGFGEPLFNSSLPAMSVLTREMFPAAKIYIDTNANFGARRAREIADCGLSEVRLGIDGSNQENYAAYRTSGNFDKAFAFAGALADAIRRSGSKTHVIWKYILFRHNDSDEAVLAAARMANEIGVTFQLDRTYGVLASKRPLEELSALVGNEIRIGSNVDPAAASGVSNRARPRLRLPLPRLRDYFRPFT